MNENENGTSESNDQTSNTQADTQADKQTKLSLDASDELTPEIQEQMLADLKHKADTYGIKYHSSIKSQALSVKISEELKRREANANTVTEGLDITKPEPTAAATPAIAGNNPRSEAGMLVRIILNPIDPLKTPRGAEMFGAGNSVAGMFKKVIPYGKPWHVPKIIVNMLQEKKYMTFTTREVKGHEVKSKHLMPAYNIQILPDLTPEEINDLRQRQLMAQGTQPATNS